VAFNASTGAEIKSKTNHARSPFNECRELETRVLRKITLRIVPFVMLLYFIASSTASTLVLRRLL
jgi:hypothetical protein